MRIGVSFFKLAACHHGEVKRDYLERALQGLLALQRAGKLPPANTGWIAAIQQTLAEDP